MLRRLMLRCLLSSCIHTHLSSWHVLIHIWVRDMYWYTPEFVALILGSWYLGRGGIATAMPAEFMTCSRTHLSSWHLWIHIWVRDICGYTSEFVSCIRTHLSPWQYLTLHLSSWQYVTLNLSSWHLWIHIWVRDIYTYTFESLIVPHSTSEFVTCIDFKSEFVTLVDTHMSSLHVYIWIRDSTPLYLWVRDLYWM